MTIQGFSGASQESQKVSGCFMDFEEVGFLEWFDGVSGAFMVFPGDLGGFQVVSGAFQKASRGFMDESEDPWGFRKVSEGLRVV